MNEADKRSLKELAELYSENAERGGNYDDVTWYIEKADLIRRTLQEIERLEKNEAGKLAEKVMGRVG